MLLPTKIDLNKAKAQETKRQIDEGLSLAKRVDAMRLLRVEQETNINKWKDETVKTVQKEINDIIEQREIVKKEIIEAIQVRDELKKPLVEEWENINEEKSKLSKEKEESISQKKEFNKEIDRIEKLKSELESLKVSYETKINKLNSRDKSLDLREERLLENKQKLAQEIKSL